MRFAPRSHQEDMESARTKGGNIASEAGGQIWRRSNLGKSCMCCKEDRSRRQEAEAPRAQMPSATHREGIQDLWKNEESVASKSGGGEKGV